MTRFRLNADNIFIDGEGGQVNIWKVENINKLNEPLLYLKDWTRVPTVLNPSYDELEVFDSVIRGSELNRLVQELRNCSWTINREGCIYMCRFSPVNVSFRLNDFFGWSKYGVHPTGTTVWNKLEMDTMNIVVDLKEKDKSLKEYKQKLEEREKKLANNEKRLKEKEKEVKELSSCKERLTEKEKELSDLKIRFAEKEEKFKVMEKDLKEKTSDLNDAKAELKAKGRAMDVLITLWEKHLGLLGPSKNGGRSEDNCEQKQEELEKELQEVKRELSIERKKANAFKAALKCLVAYLTDFTYVSLPKTFEYEMMLPTLCEAKHVDSLKQIGGSGINVSRISTTVLQIVEEQNYI